MVGHDDNKSGTVDNEDGVVDGAKMIVLRPSQSSGSIALILLPPSYTCFVSGFCHLTSLKGYISINGFSLKSQSTRRNVCAPAWTPALPLKTATQKEEAQQAGKTLGGKQALQKALKKASKLDLFRESLTKLEELELHDHTNWVLVEGILESEQEWMVAAEGKESYKERVVSKGQVVSLSSAVVACRVGLDALGIHQLVIPPSWDAAVSNAESLLAQNKSSKLLICGAKGVGKSSCLRYTINRLLAKNKMLCLLDCDVGQPECSPPGMLGLHLLVSPILAPPHLNLRRPLASYYYGDVTSKSGPDTFIAAMQALVSKYHEVRDAFASGAGAKFLVNDEESEALRKKRAKLSNNPFAVFNTYGDDVPTSMPLVVNTDGYIRYMGAEVLGAIVDMVDPDRVFHMVTEKDRYLPALSRYLNQSLPPASGSEDAAAPAGASSRASASKSSPSSAQADERPPEYSSQVVSVVPGKWTPSNISAVDLRNLRLVAHFLRHHRLLGSCVHQPSSPLSVPLEHALHIRNGALVDRNGAVSTALCSERAYGIPFAQAAMTCHGSSDIPEDLLPAVLNGSLVGVLSTDQPASASASAAASTHSSGEGQTAAPPRPCVGLGVVRHVDQRNDRVFVIIPTDQHEQSQLPANVVLAKGALQLPMSMTYSPLMPVHCYATGESAGDGSTKMSHRNNVKRRRQTQGH